VSATRIGTVEAMAAPRLDRLRPFPVAVFAGITLFIWGNRIWLAWTQKGVDLPAKLALSIPITAFVIAAVVLLVALIQGRDRTSKEFVGLVRWFAVGTVAFWAIRAPMILVHHHPVPFKVVHAVLAIVSVAAAAVAWRSVGFGDDQVEGGAGRGGGSVGAQPVGAGVVQQGE
jgi:hypothetical protein